MKLFIRTLCLLLALLCLPAPAALGEADEAQLTLFVYVTGSDLESGGGAATSDITEMLRSGVDTSRVNILLMTGGSRKWWGGFPNDKVCIWQAAGARPTQLWQGDMASLGEPEMLSFFLNYGCENFPARQYALILWDHGGGPLEGVCYDELYSSDSLSMAELNEALEASPFGPDNRLEWIGFDACLMASVETALVCAPYAKYMIASQETEPGTGWNYSFLKGLEEGVDGAEAGRRVVDAYFDSATETTLPDLTLGCIELSKTETIRAAMDSMFGQLDAILSPESFSLLSNSRRDTKNFGRATTGSDYDLVDLYNLAQQYAMVAPEGSDALLAAVEDAVVYKRSGSDDSCGLSVYYPYYNKDRYTSVWGSLYDELGFSEGYNQYLNDYAALWLGESMADWQGLRATALPPGAGVQQLTMELTQAQVEHYAWSELYILGEFGSDDAYYELYHLNDVTLDTPETLPDDAAWSDGTAGLLSADYEYQALYVTDEEGNPLTDALPYIQMDDTYLVRASLSDVNAEEDFAGWANDENGAAVYLTCKSVPGTDELRVTGAIDMQTAPLAYIDEDELLLTGKQTLDPADWPWIEFVRRPRLRTEAEDGSVLPYTDWPDVSEVTPGWLMAEYYSVDNSRPWTLKFCREQNSGRNLWAQYIVVDTQGERFASELLPIGNPNLLGRYELNQTLVDEDNLEITLDSIEVMQLENAGGEAARNGTLSSEATGVGSSGLYLRLNVKNSTGVDVSVTMDKIVFDDTAINYRKYGSSVNGTADGDSEMMLFVPAAKFPMLRGAPTHELSFELTVENAFIDAGECRVPVHVDEGIDLGNMVSALPEWEILSETVKGDVTYQLLTLEEDDDGSLTCDMRVINEGADDIELIWAYPDCAINDCVIGEDCWGEDFVVPAGCDFYTRMGFFSPGYADQEIYDSLTGMTFTHSLYSTQDPRFSVPTSLDYWGIAQVRKLSVEAYDDERLDFTLGTPLPLKEAPAGHEERAIFEGEGVGAHMCELAVIDGQLRLYLTLQNDTAALCELGVSSLYINGSAADADVKFEGDDWVAYGSRELPPGLTFRAVMEVSLDGLDMHSELRDIAINFVCKAGDEEWEYATEAQVRLTGGDSLMELESARRKPDELEIVAGKTGGAAAALADPLSFLDSQLWVPEDMARYRLTLGARIPEERVADFEQGIMLLFDEDEYSYRVYYIQPIPEVGEDGWLLADYAGLLLRGVGAPEPLITRGSAPDGDGVDVSARGLSLVTEYVMASGPHFDNVNIHIDLADNSAQVQSAQFEREVRTSERLKPVANYSHMRKVPTRDERGELKFVDDWDMGSIFTGYSFPLTDGRIQLEVLPAQDYYGLKVLFSVRNRDGSGYSLEPMTYDEAIVDAAE